MAAPKRAWTKQGLSIEQVISSDEMDALEQLYRQAVARIEMSARGEPIEMKELAEAHKHLQQIKKTFQDRNIARQAADRERARRRALAGDNALSSDTQLP